MAIPVWPEALPISFIRDGYEGSFADGRERAPAEFGPADIFLKTSASVTPIKGRIVVDRSGLALLKRFWNVDLRRGRRRFILPDQEQDGAVLFDSEGAPILDSAGEQIVAVSKWLVQFVDPPSYSPFGVQWAVTLSIEILPL